MPDIKIEERGLPGIKAKGENFREIEKAKDAKKTLRRLIAYFKAEKPLIVLMLFLVIVGTAASLLAPRAQSAAIDIAAGIREENLLKTVLLMLLLYSVYAVSLLAENLISSHLSQSIVSRMRQELFKKIISLPIARIDENRGGDFMSRMTNDIENISTTISQSLTSLFSGSLLIVGTMAMMLSICLPLALLSFIAIALTAISAKLLAKAVRKYSRKRQQLLGTLNADAEEMITNFSTIFSCNMGEKCASSFSNLSDRLTREGIRTDSYSGVMGPVMNAIGNISFVIIAVFGGLYAYYGVITVGIISAFIVYARQFSRPLNDIAQIFGQFQIALAGAERIFSTLDLEDEDQSGTNPEHLDDSSISFEHVSFSYDGKKNAINDFSLVIPEGRKIALVGATGSGKTTIANLLLRFYDCGSGTIRIGHEDINNLSRSFVRNNISVVPQETNLFSTTIRENLAYANENADDALIWNGIKMSQSEDLVKAMPNALDTLLEKSGSNISQGEMQLLAIARAFIAERSILILDEATSNIDTGTEKKIQEAMAMIMKNRTSLIIAHRLSTIRDSDLIVVMDKGSIAEKGTHDELIRKKGIYYELYMSQYQGYAT